MAVETPPPPTLSVETPKLPKWVCGNNLATTAQEDAFAKMAKMFTTRNDNQSPSPSPREELEAKRLSPNREIGPKP
jgi:hypothetical protein